MERVCPEMRTRRSFTPEYKKEIIKLITERGKTVRQVSKDIDVSETSIYRWIKQYGQHGEDAFPGKGNLLPEDEKLRKLQQEIFDLREENEILKKAMAIFTRRGK